MDIPVVFWWQDPVEGFQQAEGRTYDVSEWGVFVLASRCPPPGAHVKVKIPISEVPDAQRSLRMEMEGHVLRVEQIARDQGRDGFAILGDQAFLRENAEGHWGTEAFEMN